MNKITWLHLSDWHQTGKDIHRKIVRDKLIEDIKNRQAITPDLATIDFIIFSGDLANSANPQEYKAAQEYFLEPILKATDLSPGKVFFVPGNHDFDRNEIDFLPAKIQNPLKNENDVREWLSHERKKSAILEPFKAYREFVNSFNQQNSPEYASVKKLTLNNNTIGLLGINSALMAARNKDSNGRIADKECLIVGESQVYDPLESIKDCQIKIAVLHHPFNWLAEFDSKRVKSRLGRGCHFILCGHEHLPEVEINNSPTNGNHVIIPAGASYEQLDYPNSYNFVHLDLERNTGDVYLRKWSRERDEFIKHEEASRNGQFSIASLPDQLGQLSNYNNSLKVEFPQESRKTDTVSAEKPRSLDLVMKEVLSGKKSLEEKRDTTVNFLSYLRERPELNDEEASSILNTAIEHINENDGSTTQPSTEMDKAFHKVLHSPRFAELCYESLLQSYINANGECRKAIAIIIFYKLEIEDSTAKNVGKILNPLLNKLIDHNLNTKQRIEAGLKLVEVFFKIQSKKDFVPQDILSPVINALFRVLSKDILNQDYNAIVGTAIWALGWLTNAKYCHFYPHRDKISASQYSILRKIIEDRKQDPFARSWSALILSVCVAKTHLFTQEGWISKWAELADDEKSPIIETFSPVFDSNNPNIRVIKCLVKAEEMPIEVRKNAAIVLGRLEYFIPEIVEPLLSAFHNTTLPSYERDEALFYLVVIGNPQVISALKKGMKSKSSRDNYDLKWRCFLALNSMGDRDARQQRPFFTKNKDKFLAQQGHQIHKLKAKDSTGRWAYYFVYVESRNEQAFLDALESNASIDLENFGQVVGSCYGEQPNDELRALLKNKYGFDV